MGRSWPESLRALREGNRNYISGTLTLPHKLLETRPLLEQGQSPHTIVIGCCDSRVPPEILFDQEPGRLFVMRTAGNVVDTIGLGSLEYAAEHLEVPLMVMLGHSLCGAVSTAFSGLATGHIGSILAEISPAVDAVRELDGDRLDLAIRENAIRSILRILERSPLLSSRVSAGLLAVLAAHNDLATGNVSFFSHAPSGVSLPQVSESEADPSD